MKIKKGDKVKIITGKDKGREGVIDRVFPKKKAVIVGGLNIYKKTVRPRKKDEKGGIVERACPLNVSNVVLFCPKCGQPTRVSYRWDDSKKIRICKKCHQPI